MKRLSGIFVTLTILIVLGAGTAWAGTYFSGNLGFAIRSDSKLTRNSGRFDNDPALVVNAAVGTSLRDNFRIEGEIGYHRNGADRTTTGQDFSFSVLSFMGNAYIDLHNKSALTPFFGVGVGFGIAGASEDSADTSDSDFVGAAQLMAGAAYDLSAKASLTFQYRYFFTSDPDFNLAGPGFFETEYDSHDFLFGARFRF